MTGKNDTSRPAKSQIIGEDNNKLKASDCNIKQLQRSQVDHTTTNKNFTNTNEIIRNLDEKLANKNRFSYSGEIINIAKPNSLQNSNQDQNYNPNSVKISNKNEPDYKLNLDNNGDKNLKVKKKIELIPISNKYF